MFDLFATILAWFYAITHNYAIAIAMLTLCVMIVLTPLTLKGTKSMLQLQKLQPQVKRLQAEHKGDRQKLNEEMMALYKENRINPLSGCLPLLLQAPIFFILYRVLSGLTRTCPSDGEIGGVSCASVGSSVGTFFPDYVKQSSELFQSLVGKTEMLAFGLDLSKPATQQLSEGFINGLPYLILVLVVGALSYYQQRQVSSRMKDNVNPQQQMIMKVLPAFFALISLTLPAGLIVYFLTSSCYRIAQQAYITRRFYRDEGSERRRLRQRGEEGQAGAQADAHVHEQAQARAQARACRPAHAEATDLGSGHAAPTGDQPQPTTSDASTSHAAGAEEEVAENLNDGVGGDDREVGRGGQGGRPRPARCRRGRRRVRGGGGAEARLVRPDPRRGPRPGPRPPDPTPTQGRAAGTSAPDARREAEGGRPKRRRRRKVGAAAPAAAKHAGGAAGQEGAEGERVAKRGQRSGRGPGPG